MAIVGVLPKFVPVAQEWSERSENAEVAGQADLWRRPGGDDRVYVEDMLVPLQCLLNGTTARREKRASVRYYHVALDCHEVIVAEGLAVESYLDTGTRVASATGDARLKTTSRALTLRKATITGTMRQDVEVDRLIDPSVHNK